LAPRKHSSFQFSPRLFRWQRWHAFRARRIKQEDSSWPLYILKMYVWISEWRAENFPGNFSGGLWWLSVECHFNVIKDCIHVFFVSPWLFKCRVWILKTLLTRFPCGMQAINLTSSFRLNSPGTNLGRDWDLSCPSAS